MTPRTLRRRRLLSRTDRLTTVWMALALVCMGVTVVGRVSLPQPLWTMVHVVTLGVLSNGILQWSWYFTRAVLRLPMTDHRVGRDNAIRILLFNAAIVLLTIGMWRQLSWLTVTAAGAVGAIIAWHGLALVSCLRTRLGNRLSVIVRYYAAAAGFLVLGCVFAGLVTVAMFGHAAPAWILTARDDLTLAHALVNLLGWVGISILGTLVMLGPTMLRGPLTGYAVPFAKTALPVIAASVLLAVVGALCGMTVLVGVGLVVYAAAAMIGVLAAVLHVAIVKSPRAYATWTMTGGLLWGVVAISAVAINAFTTETTAGLREADLPWLTVIGAGCLAPIFVAALTSMMPVVIGGGPSAARVGIGVLETAAPVRVIVRNAALLLIATAPDGPAGVRIAWWLLVLLTFAVDIVLLALAGIRQAHAREDRPQILIQLYQALADSPALQSADDEQQRLGSNASPAPHPTKTP